MKRWTHIVLLSICGCSVVATSAGAQADSTFAQLIIETNAPDAFLSVDGTNWGRVGEGPFRISYGQHRLTLTEQSAETWSMRQVSHDLVVSDSLISLELKLPLRYRVEAFPSSAEIVHVENGQETRLGRSPVVLDVDRPLAGDIFARMEGYESVSVAPGDSLLNRHTLILSPVLLTNDSDEAEWMAPEESRRWVDYAAAGVALASAGLAIYYKFEADGYDDRYREPGSAERGDPALREQAERLDGYSLVSLGVMQAALGFLAVRFVLR
ncbi:MAG: hypothetical protein R3284_00315 [Rubricoccaceae bacterium]|nr:hypothetical protein [Rubricoccaceae bacterium]